MPSFEEIESFFVSFERDMRDLGLAVMDNFIYYWDAPTTDELIQIEVDDNHESSDDEN